MSRGMTLGVNFLIGEDGWAKDQAVRQRIAVPSTGRKKARRESPRAFSHWLFRVPAELRLRDQIGPKHVTPEDHLRPAWDREWPAPFRAKQRDGLVSVCS